MRTLTILIGPSGSGKSTWCSAHPDSYVCSADDFFLVESESGERVYKFDSALLGYAHQTCLGKTRRAIAQGISSIVLDNTNQKISEIAPYVKLATEGGYEVRFLVFSERDPAVLAARNSHGLSLDGIALQLERIATLLQQWPAEWPAYETA